MYIVNNWTDELFVLMMDKFMSRKEAINNALKGKKTVSEDELFAQMGNKLKVIKHDKTG